MAHMYLGDGADTAEASSPGTFGTILNWLGAFMSLALIGGLSWWGYDLAVRDVAGVPVVRALEGPMRTAPADPGGRQAAHQGLAVNSVAAEGSAEPPPDRLVLAPPPADLTDEDLPQADLSEAVAEADVAEVDVPEAGPAVENDVAVSEADGDAQVLAIAEALAESVTPLSATAEIGERAESAESGFLSPSVQGVARSVRPMPRPAVEIAARAAGAELVLAAASAASATDVDPETLPAGTRLVQFGAYDSPEAARAAWDRLDARFTDFLAEKGRVIQRATSGGKTFWRLRAMNFTDINDARRFCSAFLAERQPCIPVVTR